MGFAHRVINRARSMVTVIALYVPTASQSFPQKALSQC
eukprot:COSAG01_NODE_53178_length_341_cov_0.636364_1_plen_37_part_01